MRLVKQCLPLVLIFLATLAWWILTEHKRKQDYADCKAMGGYYIRGECI